MIAQKRVPELHPCLFTVQIRSAQNDATRKAADAGVNTVRVRSAKRSDTPDTTCT